MLYDVMSAVAYESRIQGTANEPYHTVINTEHPRKSHCNCPFAKDRRVICRHMVALLFTIFPGEADAFMREVKESEQEEQRWREEHYQEMEHRIKGLKKEELQRELLSALIELEERERRYW